MYYRARHYDPLTGEFVSRDLMEFVDGMSDYRSYVGLTYVDPSGMLTYMDGNQYKCQARKW